LQSDRRIKFDSASLRARDVKLTRVYEQRGANGAGRWQQQSFLDTLNQTAASGIVVFRNEITTPSDAVWWSSILKLYLAVIRIRQHSQQQFFNGFLSARICATT